MADERNLYNPHDGLTGRDGGPYLDQEERNLAEIIRAAKEGREPDFENAPATAGTPLVTAATLVQIANPASNPSQEAADPYAYAVDSLAKDESFPVNAFTSRPKTEEEVAADKGDNPEDIHSNPANATVVSTDGADVDPQTREVAKPVAKKAAAKKATAKKAASAAK